METPLEGFRSCSVRKSALRRIRNVQAVAVCRRCRSHRTRGDSIRSATPVARVVPRLSCFGGDLGVSTPVVESLYVEQVANRGNDMIVGRLGILRVQTQCERRAERARRIPVADPAIPAPARPPPFSPKVFGGAARSGPRGPRGILLLCGYGRQRGVGSTLHLGRLLPLGIGSGGGGVLGQYVRIAERVRGRVIRGDVKR